MCVCIHLYINVYKTDLENYLVNEILTVVLFGSGKLPSVEGRKLAFSHADLHFRHSLGAQLLQPTL